MSDRDASIARMNTTSKNEQNVEAFHPSSEPLIVEGSVTAYRVKRGNASRLLDVIAGQVAVYSGKCGHWGPHLAPGQDIVVLSYDGRRFAARVERYVPSAKRTHKYYTGPVTPTPSSYVVMIQRIEEAQSRGRCVMASNAGER